MPHSDRESIANLAEHYRKRGNEEKYQHYVRKLEGMDAGEWCSSPQETAPEHGNGVLRARGLFAEGRFEDVIDEFVEDCSPVFVPPVFGSLMRLGRFEEAEAYLEKFSDDDAILLRRRTLSLLPAIREQANKVRGRVHILLLAHNREEYLERALTELSRTDYDDYAVFMADNGSTDGTWEVMRRCAGLFPDGVSVCMERFPTNIGRPAGHNWLLTRFDHADAEFIAIADDDLMGVPQAWLREMLATMQMFEGAAVVGGAALSPAGPRVVHGGIRRMCTFGPDRLEMTHEGEELSEGQFDVIDRVDHVIGCLHVYRRAALFDVGLFDVRFSPCQLVDIEHHLRTRLAGYDIIFNGFIEFTHLRGMGRAAGNDRAMSGNSLGNIIKLLYKYDQGAVRTFLGGERIKYRDWLCGCE